MADRQKRVGPYIGITGFMELAEVVRCAHYFHRSWVALNDHPGLEQMKFMVGVLVSSKTLAGETNKWLGRYPKAKHVSELFEAGATMPYLLNTVHYNTDDPHTIDEQIDRLIIIYGPNMHAIQLNIKWVSPVKLQRVRRKYPWLRIILQVGAGALDEVAEVGDMYLGDALKSYRGVADDFLVDPSGGRGEPLDVWYALACLSDKDIPAGMRPGMAGGWCGATVPKAAGVMRRLGIVNLDAEGKLRSSMEEGDHLRLDEAQLYIERGMDVYKRVSLMSAELAVA